MTKVRIEWLSAPLSWPRMSSPPGGAHADVPPDTTQRPRSSSDKERHGWKCWSKDILGDLSVLSCQSKAGRCDLDTPSCWSVTKVICKLYVTLWTLIVIQIVSYILRSFLSPQDFHQSNPPDSFLGKCHQQHRWELLRCKGGDRRTVALSKCHVSTRQ